MSTILNTLKKLEEEKSVLDRNVDLKGLVLRGESSMSESSARGRSGQWPITAIFIVVGLVLAIAVGVVWTRQTPRLGQAHSVDTKLTANATAATFALPLEATDINSQEGRVGVSMASISNPIEELPFLGDEEDLYYEPRGNVVRENDVADSQSGADSAPTVIPAAEVAEVTEASQARVANVVDTVASQARVADDPDAPMDMAELKELIANAASVEIPVPPQRQAAPDYDQYTAMHIPGVKVKGIIFFTSGNPANYLLLSTRKDPNQKMAVGDSVQGATLVDIQRKAGIFSYQSKLTKLTLGE